MVGPTTDQIKRPFAQLSRKLTRHRPCGEIVMSRLLQALGHIATIVQLGIWIVLGGAVAAATVADLSDGRGWLEVAVYSLTGLMGVASLSLLVWLFFQKSQPMSGPAPPSASLSSILLPVGCVLFLALIALNGSRVTKVAAASAPQPTLHDMVNAAITQGESRAQPANPVDRSRAFHYEIRLSQGRVSYMQTLAGHQTSSRPKWMTYGLARTATTG